MPVITTHELKAVKNRFFHSFISLFFNDKTNKVDITGYLVMKGLNNKVTDSIKYDLIFENQYNGNQIIKNMNRYIDKARCNAPR